MAFSTRKGLTRTPVTPPALITWYPAGKNANYLLPGDLVIIRHDSFLARVIQFGERLWCPKAWKQYAWTNHIAVAFTNTKIAQATGQGITLADIRDYQHKLYAVVSPTVSDTLRDEAVTYVKWSLGERYGWFQYVGIVLSILTHLHIATGTDSRLICSQHAAEAHKRLGLIPDKTIPMPSDVARYFRAVPPSGLL